MEWYWQKLARMGLIRLADEGGDGGGGGEPTGDAADAEVAVDGEHLEGEESLQDAGKKALDAMKADRNKARREAKEAREDAERLKAAAEGREAEWESERKAREAADQRFQERIFNAELKAIAATEGVKHPDILGRLIDPANFPLDDEGNLDSSAITEAVKSAITTYDLAVQDGRRFSGSADAGVRNDGKSTQLSRNDLKSMTPEQISKAKSEGRLNNLLGVK